MHVIEWVTKTVNRDGENLRHLKSQKINLFQSFLYLWAFNLVFMCPTLCQLKTTCLLLMKQKLYALDAFFIEKLKLSENDPYTILGCTCNLAALVLLSVYICICLLVRYIRIGECPSIAPFLENNGPRPRKGPRSIVFKEWNDTRTFAYIKSTHRLQPLPQYM